MLETGVCSSQMPIRTVSGESDEWNGIPDGRLALRQGDYIHMNVKTRRAYRTIDYTHTCVSDYG